MIKAWTPGGRTVATFRVSPRAGRAPDPPPPPGATRFLIGFFRRRLVSITCPGDPSLVETVATASAGRILRTFLTPNTHTRGFLRRSAHDVTVDPGQSTDLRVFLRAGPKALTETWTFPWRA